MHSRAEFLLLNAVDPPLYFFFYPNLESDGGCTTISP